MHKVEPGIEWEMGFERRLLIEKLCIGLPDEWEGA